MTEAGDRLPFDPIDEARRHWLDQGWNDAADGMVAITSLMRAHQIALSRADAVVRPLGITFARYEVLMLLYLSKRKALPMRIIGSRLQVHAASVTNAVDRLESAGLVSRQPHPDDGRALVVAITADGIAMAQNATAALNSTVFANPGVSGDDMADLVRILGRMRSAAGDF